MLKMRTLIDRYEKEHLPKLADSTRRDYQKHLRTLRQAFGSLDPRAIKPRDVARFLDVETGKQIRNKQVAVLSNVFTYIIAKWYIDGCEANPCLRVKRHPHSPRTRYITNDEFKAVRRLAPKIVRIAMDLAYLTGQRQGDLLDLRWDQVQDGCLLLTQSKTKKKMAIRIGKRLRKTLRRARRYGPPGAREYILCTATGARFSHAGFRVKWQRVMRKAIDDAVIEERFTFHDIRAKCASDSKDLHVASLLLGHASLAMTRRVYDRGTRVVESLA